MLSNALSMICWISVTLIIPSTGPPSSFRESLSWGKSRREKKENCPWTNWFSSYWVSEDLPIRPQRWSGRLRTPSSTRHHQREPCTLILKASALTRDSSRLNIPVRKCKFGRGKDGWKDWMDGNTGWMERLEGWMERLEIRGHWNGKRGMEGGGWKAENGRKGGNSGH